jgi:hypothetical protein
MEVLQQESIAQQKNTKASAKVGLFSGGGRKQIINKGTNNTASGAATP